MSSRQAQYDDRSRKTKEKEKERTKEKGKEKQREEVESRQSNHYQPVYLPSLNRSKKESELKVHFYVENVFLPKTLSLRNFIK